MPKNYQVPLRYSQNFVKSPALIDFLIEKVNINKEDLVYDIGAGKGIITKSLIQHAKKIIAIEKDRLLADDLKKLLNTYPNLQVLNQDFLKSNLPNEGDYKVFSNIPFSISSEIIKKLCFDKNPPSYTYLFLQKEVALKIQGHPFGKETQTSLLLKPFFEIKSIYKFSREDFTPMPSVEIFLVEFKKIKSKIELQYKELYRKFIVYALNQWKPNLKLSLKKLFSHIQLKIISNDLKFDLEAKPTDLSFDQWLNIFYKYLEIVPKYKDKLLDTSDEKMNNSHLKMRKNNLQTSETKII